MLNGDPAFSRITIWFFNIAFFDSVDYNIYRIWRCNAVEGVIFYENSK